MAFLSASRGFHHTQNGLNTPTELEGLEDPTGQKKGGHVASCCVPLYWPEEQLCPLKQQGSLHREVEVDPPLPTPDWCLATEPWTLVQERET